MENCNNNVNRSSEWYRQGFTKVCFSTSPTGGFYEPIEKLLALETEACTIVQVSRYSGVVFWDSCGHIYPFHLT